MTYYWINDLELFGKKDGLNIYLLIDGNWFNLSNGYY